MKIFSMIYSFSFKYLKILYLFNPFNVFYFKNLLFKQKNCYNNICNKLNIKYICMNYFMI